MSIRREDLLKALPYARRYARALSGSQQTGDGLVAAALREVLDDDADEGEGDGGGDGGGRGGDIQPRHVLYGAVTSGFHERVKAGAITVSHPNGALDLNQRILLLLTALEEVPIESASLIVGLDAVEAGDRLRDARLRLRSASAADVLIIEDEPIIAMDIEELVQSCGHNVVGVAGSEAEAIEIASRTRPGLILADINLGLGGDGASAVAKILKQHNVPVIFVTAYPERLLTGEAVEPTFVITKPFEPVTLAIATYQAVTGGVKLG